jgi:hypothetical protein
MASTALAVRPHGELPAPAEWQLIAQMGSGLFRSGLLPAHVRNEQAAAAIIQKGRELGVPPMHALCSIVVIQGKPTANAELMLALIYRDHGDEAFRFVETTAERCTAEYRRRGGKEAGTFTFTLEEAKLAGLFKNEVWNKYPAAMLRARTISAVARMAFPDTIGGMYTPEEVGAQVTVDDEGAVSVTVEGEVVDDHRSAARPTPIDAARSQGFRVEPVSTHPAKTASDAPEFVVRTIPDPLDLYACRHWLGDHFCPNTLTESVGKDGKVWTPTDKHQLQVEKTDVPNYPVCEACFKEWWSRRDRRSWTILDEPAQDAEIKGDMPF